MNRMLILSLSAASLAFAPFATPTAQACGGGYAQMAPDPEAQKIATAVQEHFARARAGVRFQGAIGTQYDLAERSAGTYARFERGGVVFTQQIRLQLRSERWRVVGGGPPALASSAPPSGLILASN